MGLGIEREHEGWAGIEIGVRAVVVLWSGVGVGFCVEKG